MEKVFDEKTPLCPYAQVYTQTKDFKPNLEARVPLCVSFRLLIACCCTVTLLTSFASQMSMSSALVCMITTSNTSEAPPASGNNTTSLHNGFTLGTVQNLTDNIQAWKFDWSTPTQEWIVFCFFITYFVMQIPSGLCTSRLGPTRIILIGLFSSSACNVLTVLAAWLGLPYLYLIRSMAGGFASFLNSGAFDLIGNWSPRRETSILFGITGLGIEAGNIFSYGTAYFACQSSWQGGWPFVFYTIGGLQLILAMIIYFVVTDFPVTNRFIGMQETVYIQSPGVFSNNKPIVSTPIGRILKSMPVYAATVSQLGTMTMFYAVVTQGPVYLRDVLHFSTNEINWLSSTPFLAIIPFIFVIGALSDWLIHKGFLTTTNLRKINDVLCKLFAALVMLGLGFLPDQHVMTVFCLYLLLALSISLSYASFIATPGDLSPLHSGFLFAFQNAGSLWTTFLIPPVVGGITIEKNRSAWSLIFTFLAIFQFLTVAFFVTYGSGQLQHWAVSDQDQDWIVPVTHDQDKLLTEERPKQENDTKSSYLDGDFTTNSVNLSWEVKQLG